MTSKNRSGNKLLDLSLDEIIELEQKKNESARRANIAALSGEKDEPMVTDGDEKPEKNEIRKKQSEGDATKPVSRGVFLRGNFPRKNEVIQGNKVRKTYKVNNYKAGISSGYQNYNQTNRSQTQKNNKRKQEVTPRQWAYLHHLRSVRNSQVFFFNGFALVGGESPLTRNCTSTPNSNWIYPLTKTYLKRFDSSHNSNSRISLMSLGSTARSCGSVRSFGSNCSPFPPYNRRRSFLSNKSAASNKSFASNKSAKSLCDPIVAMEIAHLQSSLVDNPNYNDILQKNRQPVKTLTASSTNLSLSSRFTSYYDPPE